ncbi:hypothetical protein C7B65_03155 [Phormidesmis priestleyi ULC007]|uniref:Uncharacterized protein n=1 Tax=Phormidesmis priestleyi ULC007 TaxID=1920490 RepID=A0A2T1DM88_9CYAN|nr:hypothetical protein [Phormidesmis priestleyi]PSB21596.1 hypothetical protein C7B65_03155 [Phormidesmis priestleyi ULC007]PZO54637.1 MAG: hypothetical protein DCF14_01675 [Phormidesmis priestleyi]
MVTQIMVQPSSWVEAGIQIQKVRGLNLFKFTDELQTHLEMLLDKHKDNTLTEAEAAEFAGITELDRIFTLINARMIAESPVTTRDN